MANFTAKEIAAEVSRTVALEVYENVITDAELRKAAAYLEVSGQRTVGRKVRQLANVLRNMNQ